MVKMNGCAAIDFRPFRFFGKQCSCLYTRAILLGKSPKPLNDFREIGCAPAELNITPF